MPPGSVWCAACSRELQRVLQRSCASAFVITVFALLLPSLRDRDTRAAALLGIAIALLTTPLLPAGLPVLLALAGLVILLLPRGRQRQDQRRSEQQHHEQSIPKEQSC